MEKNQFYYVFCEISQEEFLTLKPFDFKINRYHMGTFLSEIVNIIPKLTAIKNVDEIGFIESYYDSLPGRDDLLYLLRDDDNQKSIKMFVNCLKYCLFMHTDKLEAEISRIASYNTFITLCLKYNDYCDLHTFYEFSSIIKDTLKVCEKFMVIPDYFPNDALNFDSSDDLYNLFTKSHNKQNSKLDFYKNSIKELKDNEEVSTNKNSNKYKLSNFLLQQCNEESKGHFFHFYAINSITDIISASLQSIFGVKCKIKECELCRRIFVPKRSDARFCDKKCPKDKKHVKTCKEYQRTQKELERQNRKEYMKIYRSRKNSIDNSTKISDQEKKEFEEISYNYFRLIDEKSQNEQDKEELDRVIAAFIAWLKTTYIRKPYKQRILLQTLK